MHKNSRAILILILILIVLPLMLTAGASRSSTSRDSAGSRLPAPPASFSRAPVLRVLVVSPEGNPLGGAALKLCESDRAEGCRAAITNPQGEAVFDEIRPAEYQLQGELSGFASTRVSPLSIAARSPAAPDRIVLLLNPVCWDC